MAGQIHNGDTEMRIYRVGTFYRQGKRKGTAHCYTTWYHPSWDGCIEYNVKANSGAEAKRLAKLAREYRERLISGARKRNDKNSEE